tara:strand:+ start:1783 stop:2466 length:684 start_codon:yes stop_codon:yes gene_type:complete
MSKLVFDIETIGEDFGKIDKITQKILLKKAKTKEEKDGVKNKLVFSPFTGEIVAIGVLDVDKEKGAVYFQAPDKKIKEQEENGVKLKAMSEPEMLKNFWHGAENYSEFISFNGGGFDVPYLMIRSAIHKIRPSKNLMSNRYLGSQKFDSKHVDLMDQLAFYNQYNKTSLHLACRAFGIESPKAQGVAGDDVGKLFRAKKYLDIAKYNIRDLISTRELYEYWDEYLRF